MLKRFLNNKQLIVVSLFYAGAYIAWSIIAGKDLNWDSLNYHYGLAHIYFTGTFNDHFYPANIQSALNPIGYFPFYYMVSAGWHSILISSTIAAFQSLNSVLAFLIAKELFKPYTSNFLFLLLVSLFSSIGMVQLQMIGSSFIDLTISVFFLLALYLFIKLEKQDPAYKFLQIGFLLGAASILKLPYTIFAICGGIFALTNQRKIVSSLYYIAGGILGAITVGGHWHYLTWQKYQNPFFPFFNGIFGSSLFPNENIQHQKFTPDSTTDFLLQPLEFASPYSHTYIESIAPDIRFLAFFIILAISILVLISKKKKPMRTDVIIFSLASYSLWALSSANARYGLIVFFLFGILIPYLLIQIAEIKLTRITVLLLLVLQVTISFQAKSHISWASEPWTTSWYGFEDFREYSSKQEPGLYLTTQLQSASFILDIIPKNSSLMSIYGQWSLPINKENNLLLDSLINKHNSNVKAVYLLNKPHDYLSLTESEKKRALSNQLTNMSYSHKTWGFEIDTKSCQQFGENGIDDYHLYICDLRRTNHHITGYGNAYGNFSRLETICGNLRPKQGGPISTKAGGWEKYYFNEDILINISSDGKISGKQNREITPYYLGNINDLDSSTMKKLGLKYRCNMLGKNKIKVY